MQRAYFLFLFLALVGCSAADSVKKIEWDHSSTLPEPSLHQVKESKNEIQVKYLNEVVSRDVQTYKGVEIDGTYIQRIKNLGSKSLFLKSGTTDHELANLDQAIERSLKNKYISLMQFKSKYQDLKNAVHIWDPKLSIVSNEFRPSLVWVIDYQLPHDLGTHRMKLTLGGSRIEQHPIGSCFDYPALVYPSGPKLSDLSEVILDNLFGNGFLMSSGVKVYNDLKEQAREQNGRFAFEPRDSRFNQVQTYYFIDRHLKYYSQNHDLQLPFAIEARVNVMSPEGKPTTYTGYVHQRITLGAGDSVVWNNIPQDPSIVMHEVSHAIVEALAGLSYESEEGSLNEAFSDFLAASHLDNPHMGNVAYMKAPYKRSLETFTTLSEKNGMKYHDSLIVSGALWEARQVIGKTTAESLALKTLSRLGPKSQLADFGRRFRIAMQEVSLSEKNAQILEQILIKRGL